MPAYIDIETLIAKAACACSRMDISLLENIWDLGYQAIVISDKCIADIDSLLGTDLHDILIMLDPNYLLPTINCMCPEHKTSTHDDYIIAE
jgi:hypothetical protein